jgi:uncharacterized protein YbjT (DUF2867 family)
VERTALLIGATGLVGARCLRRLLASPTYSRVTVLVRRPTGVSDPKLTEVVVDFDRLAERAADVQGEDLFVCLGTTIKTAGSEEAFRRVDHDLVLQVATLAKKNGARRVALVSSVGANASGMAFYLRTKGETERDVAALRFECAELLRPSFLVGKRAESRPGEAVGIAAAGCLSALLLGPLRRYRAVDADLVAAALVGALKKAEPGVHVREHDAIVALAALA